MPRSGVGSVPIHPVDCIRFVSLNRLLSSKARSAGQSSNGYTKKLNEVTKRRWESNPSSALSLCSWWM
jgi:hypothetical protein